MIEQITDKEQLEQLIYECGKTSKRDKGFWVYARLTPEIIRQWRQQGNFRHIRNQLQNVNGIKFSCTQLEGGTCEYIFIVPTTRLKNRLYHMLNAMWLSHKKTALVNCKPVQEEENYYQIHEVHGEVKACSLF